MRNILLIILTTIILAIAGFGKYVESTIKQKATSVYEDRLVPQPYLSRKFDYYGTTIQDQIKVTKGGIIDFALIKKDKSVTDTMWAAYRKTYLAPDEKLICDKAQVCIDSADQCFEKISLDGVITDDEATEMDAKIYPVLKYVNELVDIQTTIGAEDTKSIITLLNNFSNFLIGAIALAIALLGSIIYDMFKKPVVVKAKKVTKKPVKKAVKK
jgi:hypothetical protein